MARRGTKKPVYSQIPLDKMNRSPEPRRRRKKRGGMLGIIIFLCVLLAAIIAVVAALALRSGGSKPEKPAETTTAKATTKETTTAETTTEPLVPEVVSTITVGSTGDILIHPTVLYTFDYGDHHDFNDAFTAIAPYYKTLDLMIANLEVTLVDPDDYDYSANPFRSPDAIAEALKNAGVDVCLTANNHTYDSDHYGLIRTQDVLSGLGLEYFGTRKSTDDSFVFVKEVNGIKLGMINYTYDTEGGSYFEKSLNYIPLDDEDAPLVNSFNYSNLDAFYEDVQKQIEEMDRLGCELKIFYIHWGEEYYDEPDGHQEEIAQKLCDLGVDVIVGGHPHVVQRFDVLEGEGGHQTLCLYSMGNELSNQRHQYMDEDDFRGYTEDGVVFIMTINKYNTGEVKVEAVDILPTWVESDETFKIIPLDYRIEPEKWASEDTENCIESYNRTLGRLGEKYIDFRNENGQEAVPEELEY